MGIVLFYRIIKLLAAKFLRLLDYACHLLDNDLGLVARLAFLEYFNLEPFVFIFFLALASLVFDLETHLE